tara:strand:- start:315 stop:1109 length:795 start_codon:yes stop_codon:yes gene_type:complete
MNEKMKTEFITLDRYFSEHFYVSSKLPLSVFEFDENDKLLNLILDKKEKLFKDLNEIALKVEQEENKEELNKKFKSIHIPSELSYQLTSGGTDTENIFTNAHRFYNILSDKLFKNETVIKKFKSFLKESFIQYVNLFLPDTKIFYAKVWLNVLSKWDYLNTHSHDSINSPLHFCCHYDLSIPPPKTFTCYMPIYSDPVLQNEENIIGNIQKENVEGELLCFPHFLPHKTSPNKSDEPRLTFGMDIILTEEEYHNRKLTAIFEKL